MTIEEPATRERLDTVDGQTLRDESGLDDMLARIAISKGIDPARLDDPTPVQDPRGNVLERDDLIEVLIKQGLSALSHYADGEFDFDRLPPMNKHVKAWAELHKKDPQEVCNLVLQGAVGCGKTSQCFCLLDDLVPWYARQARRFVWYYMTNRNLAAAVQPGSGRDPDALISKLMWADLLVLDDLGDYNTQDFGRAADATSRIIHHRAHHRLPTVYDTNLPYTRDERVEAAERENGIRIATLADTLDGRAISRLQSGWTVALPQVDYRAAQGKVFL
jgi:hypothetical protein